MQCLRGLTLLPLIQINLSLIVMNPLKSRQEAIQRQSSTAIAVFDKISLSMTVRFYFENIIKIDKENLQKYFREKKLSRLEKLLQRGSFELAKFVLNAKYHRHHHINIVRLGLNIGKKDFESEEKSNNLIEAVDLAFDRLINQLRKLEGKRQDI